MLKAWRRVRDYVRYDLREIVAPSSLPYPPGEEDLHKQKRITWRVLVAATREYMDTWKPEKEPEPAPGSTKTTKEEEVPLAEELAGIARAGAGTAQPLLQHLYRTRAAAYRDAMREFVEGYREGYAGLPEEEATAASGTSSSKAVDGADSRHDGAHVEGQGSSTAADILEKVAPDASLGGSMAGKASSL